MNKYEEEYEKEKSENNKSWILEYTVYLTAALQALKITTEKWKNKAPKKNIDSWFTKSRQVKLQKDIVKDMRDNLKSIEKFIENRYIKEYTNVWYRKGYITSQEGAKKGFKYVLGKTNKKLLQEAVENGLSKFMDKSLIAADRNKNMSKAYRLVKNSIKSDVSIDDTFKNLDKLFGLRDKKTNRIIKSPLKFKGIGYEYRRLLLTEINRISSLATSDEYVRELKQGIESEVIYRSVFLPNSREQSMKMDGQKADKEGRFKYPNGNWYYQGATGFPEWDANDYCFIEKINYKFRYDMKNKNIKLYDNLTDYLNANNLRVDKYNQIQLKETVKKV